VSQDAIVRGMGEKQQSRKRLKGVVDVIRSGKKGFLIQDAGGDDIEIPQEWLGGALSRDTVEAELGRKYGKEMARVVRVIERATDTFVGELIKKTDLPGQPGGLYLKPDSTRVYFDFLVKGAPGAGRGEKVVAKVVSWKGAAPSVSVVEVLGVAGEHETEMKAIAVSRGFNAAFPRDVLDEAKKLYETETPHMWTSDVRREDFRSTLTFTIDPEDAKDFDDAISLNALPNGTIEVGVHIADVSYFVRPGGAIEREAYQRATSVYLVDRTIPMLPRELSEDLCSLKPDVDRLVFSAVFTVNAENEITNRRFVRGIIRSTRRFTYEEADALLAPLFSYSQEYENSGAKGEAKGAARAKNTHTEKMPPKAYSTADEKIFADALARLWPLASSLRAERKARGAIMFENDEIRPVLDEHKHVIGFKKNPYTESHQLIEELMLLANREVATFVAKRLGKKNQLFVYRVHDKPNTDKLDELSLFVRAIGHPLFTTGTQGAVGRELNVLLDAIKGTPEEALIKTATIRTMAKAVYATKNIGHFGLSFDFYTHFTSPIRRYPDLLVHRILGTLIRGERVELDPSEEAKKALHASEREMLATEAERESIKLKQVEYFAGHIGEERAGVVSGITDWGVFIADSESGADGMVRIAAITDDSYTYEPKKYAIVGAKTGRQIRLGDPVSYTVERVNIDERTIDFTLSN